MQQFTLHTHTVGFDGRDSIAQMVNRAAELGLHTIGISNHFIVCPGIEDTAMFAAAAARGYSDMYASSFDMVMSRFIPHYAELATAGNDKIRVLRGMEVDFFNTPEWRAGFEHACSVLKPDYKIGAKHFIEYNGKLYNLFDMEHATPDDHPEMIRIYWENITRAAESGLFNWMAHLDLITRLELSRDNVWQSAENRALDAIAAAGIGVEINVKGFASLGHQYPSTRILRGCVARNIPILISDDAHAVSQIARDFNRATQIITDMGIKNTPDVDEILKFA